METLLKALCRPLRKGVLQIMTGLLVALVLVETMFWMRDGGAFPHLNCYVADDKLGVRLAPNTKTRIRFNNNPMTRVRINQQGYRGADFPPPEAGEILVVGDSQVFGLGVQESETFSAVLKEITGQQVLNAGVPTYGPAEYLAIAREFLAMRKIATVVFTLNMVNDLFEANRPNKDRHRVLDGWAVKLEDAPRSVVHFPGRKWFFGDSHLVYAWRRLLRPENPSVPSEGTWQDLHVGSGAATNTAVRSREELTKKFEDADAVVKADLWQRADPFERLIQVVAKSAPGENVFLKRKARGIDAHAERLLAAAHVKGQNTTLVAAAETIAQNDSVVVTAEMAAAAQAERTRVEAKLLRTASDTIQAAALRREQTWAELRLLRTRALPRPLAHSVLDGRLRELATLCAEHNSEVLVLILPIDVQVSPDEWRKYGLQPRDMSTTLAFTDAVAKDAARGQLATLDVRQALADAYPGIFLDGDIHMTPKGHRTVAVAIARKL